MVQETYRDSGGGRGSGGGGGGSAGCRRSSRAGSHVCRHNYTGTKLAAQRSCHVSATDKSPQTSHHHHHYYPPPPVAPPLHNYPAPLCHHRHHQDKPPAMFPAVVDWTKPIIFLKKGLHTGHPLSSACMNFYFTSRM